MMHVGFVTIVYTVPKRQRIQTMEMPGRVVFTKNNIWPSKKKAWETTGWEKFGKALVPSHNLQETVRFMQARIYH